MFILKHCHQMIIVTHFSCLNVTAGWGIGVVWWLVTITKLDSRTDGNASWSSTMCIDQPAGC